MLKSHDFGLDSVAFAIRTPVAGGVSLRMLALALAGLSAPAAAQVQASNDEATAADDARDSGIEEIVTTARRRAENLQAIPSSISAVSAAKMEDYGITSVEDVGEFAPNVTITSSSRANNTRLVIRGIGGGFPDPTQAFGTGLYINGTYIPNSVGGFMSTLDVERIEMLRGPQGTLFGRNTTGGAINVIVKKPGPEFSVDATGRVGSFGREELRAVINAPLTDELFFRASGAIQHTDGYYRNTALDIEEGGKDLQAFTASLRWQPNANWTVDQTVQFSAQDDDNKGGQCIFLGGGGANGRFIPFNVDGEIVNDPTSSRIRAECDAQQAGDPFKFASDKNVFSDVEQFGLFNTINWTSDGAVGMFDELSVTVNSSWRRTANDFLTDRDYSTIRSDSVGTVGEDAQTFETKMAEFLLEGETWDRRINFVVGYNYFDEKSRVGRIDCFDAWAARAPGEEVRCDGAKGLLFEIAPEKEQLGFPIFAGPPTFFSNIIADNESHGAFAHVKYSPLEWVTLEAGIRYTRDQRAFKTLEWLVSNFDAGVNTVGIGNFDNILNDDTVQIFGFNKAVFDEATTEFAASFKLPRFGAMDDGLVYARFAEGYLTGGFNTELPTIPVFAPIATFEPESVNSYEVGFKADWFDRRLRTNIAIYHTDYNNKQETVTIDNSDGRFPGGPNLEVISNAGSLDIDGIEFEMEAEPWRDGLLSFVLGGIDSNFKRFIGFNPDFDNSLPAGPDNPLEVDLSERRVVDFTADWTINASLQHRFELMGGSVHLVPRVGVYWQHGFEWEDTTVRGQAPTVCFQDSYAKVNARVAWRDLRRGWEVAVFGDNITDKRIIEACDVQPNRGLGIVNLEAPASWGLEFRFGWGG